MCEILYKGFHKDENGTEKIFVDDKWIKGEWVYGYYIRYGWTHQEKDYIVPLYASDLYAKEVIPETVGQYTGLTDKNGKKIFEEDIIKWGLKPCVVKLDECNASFCLYLYGTIKISGFNRDTMKLKEVIGNIYDNPELLKGAE